MPLMRARNSNMRVIFRACANERHGNSEGNTPEKKKRKPNARIDTFTFVDN